MKSYSKLFYVFIIVIFFCNHSTGQKSDWWRYTTIYEVYIRSFKDSNGDGYGDLNGVTSKLDYFVELGIETLWITPFYKSPMYDMGYDISDFTSVDPSFGTIEDFDELIKEMKKRGLKLILDFVLNHSSDEHPWFMKSINREEPYSDFYIWKEAKGFDSQGNPIPPNNWMSLFGGTGWEWNDKRKQFYYHQFAKKQPDFNLRNPQLKEEIKKVMKFWLEKGTSGLRLDATMHFFEDERFLDEPVRKECENKNVLLYYDYDHIYTTNLWDTYEFIHELRELLDNFSAEDDDDDERILIAEAYTDLDHLMSYYGRKDYPITHFPFNFKFVSFTYFPNASRFDWIVKFWLENMPKGGVANWVSDNHDNDRVASRLNEEFSDIVITSMMTLPGIACIYYGQEIGLRDTRIRPDQEQDQNNNGDGTTNRDSRRCPMQWDDSDNAGFTSKLIPWLPVNTNYYKVNVERQKNQKISRHNMFKTLSQLRKTDTAKYGDFKSFIISTWVYAYTRSAPGKPTYIVILNLGSETEIINIRSVIRDLPPILKVMSSSLNSGYPEGSKILSTRKFPRSVVMRPLSSIVLSTQLK